MDLCKTASVTLSPLQRLMLQDSLLNPGIGAHVEQVEIVFMPGVGGGEVMTAWEATVKSTRALQVAFQVHGGKVDLVRGDILLPMQEPVSPSCWLSWLEEDRRLPLLKAGTVPWRVCWWPETRRFIWTFHHSLLDGRSITRVLRAFLNRVLGGEGEVLELAHWRNVTPCQAREAEAYFREFSFLTTPKARISAFRTRPYEVCGRACRELGAEYGDTFARQVASFGVTVPTALLWCWGQARAQCLGTAGTWVEQIRAGSPISKSAGFTMNSLPVAILRATPRDPVHGLHAFGEKLRSLRQIESVSQEDFPPGIYPDLNGPEASLMMVEHGTLQERIGPAIACVSSLHLYEPETESLTASAYIAPAFLLQVEGPGSHAQLEAWIQALSLLGG